MIAAARRAAWCALPVLPLLMAACSTPPRAPANTGWLTGKLAVRVEATDTQPEHGVGGNFELLGDADRGELRLTSPLGTLVALARWSPGEAVLTTPQGDTRFGDLDELARVSLGEALPLQALPAWLHGAPWKGAPSSTTPEGFEQLGWQVGLGRFAEGWLVVTRTTPAPAVTLRARLERDR